MIPKRTLTATLEISTGSMIITNRPPAFTGEADALHVNITLLDGGIAYEPTSTIQAKLYLYWPGTVNMSEQVDLDIDENVLTGALPDTLTAVPGCPLLVIRLDDTTTGELIVAAATPIQITNVLGERVISSRPATPSEIIYVGRAPYIDETTGHWMQWDVNEGDYVDTLVPAAGSPATFTATATTLPAGSAATASITGTPQNPVLNLGIPRGADGQDSDVLSVNGLTGAVVINGSNASVSSTDDTTIAAKFGQQSDQIANLGNAISYIVNGNKSVVTVPAGAYVTLLNSTISGRADGIYTASQSIPANTVIDATYLSESVPILGGGLNDLFSLIKDFAIIRTVYGQTGTIQPYSNATVNVDVPVVAGYKPIVATIGYTGDDQFVWIQAGLVDNNATVRMIVRNASSTADSGTCGAHVLYIRNI